MTPRLLALSAAGALLLFGAAFGIGRATRGGSSDNTHAALERISDSGASPRASSLDAGSGGIPALRLPKKKPISDGTSTSATSGPDGGGPGAAATTSSTTTTTGGSTSGGSTSGAVTTGGGGGGGGGATSTTG